MRQARVAGHFGEWLQGRLGADGPVALVTLPCPVLAVTVRWQPGGPLSIKGPAAGLLPTDRVRIFLQHLGAPDSGTATVTADMTAGGGAGASTAGLLALARAAVPEEPVLDRLARACIAAEGASDPLMMCVPDAHLWASREGRSLRRLTAPPVVEVVGGFFGPPIRTDPADVHLPDVSDLVEAWVDAVERGDVAALARIGSLSAKRTTALRGPADDPTAHLAGTTGALGHLRAHTGSARGLVFAPGTAPVDLEARLTAAGFAATLRFRTAE